MGKKNRKNSKAMGPSRGPASGNLFASPIFLRIAAFVCDYLMLLVITVALTMLPFYYLTGGGVTASIADYATIGFGVPVVVGIALAATALSWVYCALLPATAWSGRTLGKRWTNTEVVMVDGSPAGLGRLTLRWLFMLVAEAPALFATIDLRQLFGLLGFDAVANVWNIASWVVLAASFIMMLGTDYHQSLHDRLLGTWVWNGNGS